MEEIHQELNLRQLRLANYWLASSKDDPQIWVTKLEYLVLQYNNTGGNMGNEEVLEHIWNNSPRCYKVVVNTLEERIFNQTNPLMTKELRKKLKLKYHKMFRRDANFGKNEG